MDKILSLRSGRKSRAFRDLAKANIAIMNLLREALAAMPREEHLQRALMLNDQAMISTLIASSKHALCAVDEARNAASEVIQMLLLYRAVAALQDDKTPSDIAI